MPDVKQAHHKGTYDSRSRKLVAAAYADGSTRCARCGLTLYQHPRTKTGRLPKWSAGHVTEGQVDGPLRPEVLSCNSRAGAIYRNRKAKGLPVRRNPLNTSRRW